MSFGAVGTPLIVGVQGGLDKINLTENLIEKGSEWDSFFRLIVSEVAIIHALCGTFMPLLLVIIMTKYFGKNKSWTEGLSIFPFAIFSALSFTIPYVLSGVIIGPEFPSIIGGIIGLAIVTTAVKKRFLIPKDTWDFEPLIKWPSFWNGNIKPFPTEQKNRIQSLNAWLPYLILAIILVFSRTFEPIKTFLNSFNLHFTNILDEPKINASFQILYLPGSILIFVCLITFFLHRMSLFQITSSIKESSKTMISAGFVLIFTVPMVRIMINSGVNSNDFFSMPLSMANGVSSLMGNIYPFLHQL